MLNPVNPARDKPISIAQVALLAGVSQTTVSHVVSGKRPVNHQTAARVRDAMKQLGYVPNHAARSLRSGMTRTIGLLVPDISNPYFAGLAKGAEDAAESLGFSVVICSTEFDHAREAKYLNILRSGVVDGMIYAAGAPPSHSRLAEVARAFPMAVADEELPELVVTTVVSDNLKGGELVGDHLRQLGHRVALYIGGPLELVTTQRRLEGFERAFNADGTAHIEQRQGDYREPTGYEAVREELAERGRWFSAVFAGNDLMAIGAMRALDEAGLVVPSDVSVVGYDDVPLAALLRPGLTTVRQPVYGIGRAAAEQLILGLLAPKRPPAARLVLDVEFIERQTTAMAARVGASR